MQVEASGADEWVALLALISVLDRDSYDTQVLVARVIADRCEK